VLWKKENINNQALILRNTSEYDFQKNLIANEKGSLIELKKRLSEELSEVSLKLFGSKARGDSQPE